MDLQKTEIIGKKRRKRVLNYKRMEALAERALRENTELSAMQRIRLKRQLRRVRIIRRAVVAAGILTAFVLIVGITAVTKYFRTEREEGKAAQTAAEAMPGAVFTLEDNRWEDFYALSLERPPMDVQLLTFNNYSRPGVALPMVNNIFIHYTANPGTSAEQNRSYFQSLAETEERSASAHFIIGYEGEIVQCVPTAEIAYAVMKRNFDSISIECCYLDESGEFTEATYNSLLELTAWLLHKFELAPEDVLRHYDEGGKSCPKYYVENEEEWHRFLGDLTSYMDSLAVTGGSGTQTDASEGA